MRFRYCLIPSLEPNSPNDSSERSRDTQEGPLLIPRCKTNVLIPRGLRRVHLPHRERDRHALYHQQWTDPGGKRIRKERQCVFFTAVKPMDEHRFSENARYNLDKARTVADKNEWKVHQNAVYWCNLKLGHKRGLEFYQNRSHAS